MDMENAVETNVVETIDGAKNAPGAITNVSYGLAKGTGKLIGGSYRIMSRFSGKMKQSCKKIPRLRHQEVSDEVAEGHGAVDFKPSAALDPGQEEATSGKRVMRALVAALESDLKSARAELEEMRSQAEGTNTPFASQLKALQKEKKSLLADLEQAKSLAQETILHKNKNAASKRVTALKSELAAVKEKLDQTDQVQAELASQLKALQKEKKSLLADLKQAKSQADEMTAHKDALSERVTALESELAEAKDQLDQAHSQTRQGQTKLKSQLNALQKKTNP